MQTAKKTKDYTVYKKGSGRFAVKGMDNKYIRGEAKTKILLKEGLIKFDLPKAKPAAESKAEGDAPAAS